MQKNILTFEWYRPIDDRKTQGRIFRLAVHSFDKLDAIIREHDRHMEHDNGHTEHLPYVHNLLSFRLHW